MTITIGGKEIGEGCSPFTILEAGINHNGDFELAKEMVRVAKAAGADAIKFQTFSAERFINDQNAMFTYKSRGEEVTESQISLFRRHEFSKEQWTALKEVCDEQDILFMSTPQDREDLALLLDIGVPALKIGSDDFTNIPLIQHFSETNLPLLMSCGMADMAEVFASLEASGANDGAPVCLLLCTSQYPTPHKDVNLRKLMTLRGAFPNLLLGFSDHTIGSVAATTALGLGAKVFEKHFTLDRDLEGPDHAFSEDPADAAQWVENIQIAFNSLGSGMVRPTAAERDQISLARRSVTALCDIEKGDVLTENNVGLQRPGTGLPARYLQDFIGQTARHNIPTAQQLKLSDIS